jgi:Cupin domain
MRNRGSQFTFIQDEFTLMQDGLLDLKLDWASVQAKFGDLVRLPRGMPHGYFNKSNKPAKAFFWVSPNGKLWKRAKAGLIPTKSWL